MGVDRGATGIAGIRVDRACKHDFVVLDRFPPRNLNADDAENIEEFVYVRVCRFCPELEEFAYSRTEDTDGSE